MPKWLPIQRLRQVRFSIWVSIILCLTALIHFFTSYGYYDYDHLSPEKLKDYFYMQVNPNLVWKNSKPSCKYDNILSSPKSINIWEIPKKFDAFVPTGIVNGSYMPEDCSPLYSVAILITYRNRQSQLDIFIPYMHNFLRRQNIHYKLYLIEQQDEKPWNKGLLYNIGAKQAMADKFPCLILHDVDLLPLDESNLYVCLRQPRHMSASIDKFRYVLIYETLVGGVLAITSDQYRDLNGFSNRFHGWGGEDDDFANRILTSKMDILRFPYYMSKYTMLAHKQERKNNGRYEIMKDNEKNFSKDGLNSVHFQSISIKPHRLFTLIGVRV